MTALPPEVELLALKALENEVVRRQKVVKAVIGQTYQDGDKHTFRSPINDAPVGIVYKTDPNPVWEIVDRDALEKHLRADDDNMQSTLVIPAADMAEALAVLDEHAPHLLDVVTELKPDAVQNALNEAKSGKTAVPGIEKRKPSGVLTPKLAEGAYERVGELVQAQLLTWDARPVLPAAEEAS